MENYERKFYYNMYIKEGEFHCNRGRSSAMQFNYYTAKSEFITAIQYFYRAVDIAKELSEHGLISYANSQIYMCEAEISRLKEKQKE